MNNYFKQSLFFLKKNTTFLKVPEQVLFEKNKLIKLCRQKQKQMGRSLIGQRSLPMFLGHLERQIHRGV